jgi:nucleotide-binding universal stress UspA family protein
MNLNKLKGRPAFPFETIAVALAFSPRLEPILAETKRIVDVLKSNLIFIHVGEKTPQKEEQLEKLMDKIKYDKNACRIIWMEGDPVETIIKLCKLNIVDVLILGALEKENILKYYLGSVARSISRRAKCSVLLLTHPSNEEDKVRKIIVNGIDNPKTIHTLNTALYIAKKFNVKEIKVVREVHSPTLAMTMADDNSAPEANKIKKEFSEEESKKLHAIVKRSNPEEIIINEKIITGKPGYAISKYAREKKTDLLVINSPDKQLNFLDRIFTHDIEHILADLPCDVLIVHSRINN